MSDEYLNGTGLGRVWAKVKALITPLGSSVDTLGSRVTSLENRTETLESEIETVILKYMTDVDGITFNVSFSSLADVTVTGVWNEAQARIEF